MPIIKIQTDTVRQQGSRFSQAASDLTTLHWDINRLANQLDWEVRGKGHVEAKIGEAATLGKKLYEEAQRLSEYLKTCTAALEEADSQGQQSISATMSTASLSTGLMVGSSAVGAGVLAGVIAGGKTFRATTLKWIKGVFGWTQESQNDDTATVITHSERYSEIEKKLELLRKKPSYKVGAISNNGYLDDEGNWHDTQCKGFANQVFKEINGKALPQTKPNGYEYYDSPVVKKIGESITYNGEEVTTEQISNYFENAHIGDVIQINYRGNPHSAIVGGIIRDDKGTITSVQFYDSNYGSVADRIDFREVQVSDIAKSISFKTKDNCGGITVYTPSNATSDIVTATF